MVGVDRITAISTSVSNHLPNPMLPQLKAILCAAIIAIGAFAIAGGIVSADPGGNGAEFLPEEFASHVLPLLRMRCVSCHGQEKREGGLRLDTRRTTLLGGDNGPVLQPGSSENSELIARLRSQDDARRMPLGESSLEPEQIERFRRWIDAGAPWPDALAGQEVASTHWSFRPIDRPAVPAVRDAWPRSAVDSFLLDRQRRQGLHPASDADRPMLLRRLHLDLLGLPPAADEIEEYLNATGPDDCERLVDRLLASHHFGERWGKHWLDLARFAESDGYENDNLRPNAWRFRDWVTRSINDDMGFDEFTVWQLAGDLREQTESSNLVATGFHRNTLYNSAGGADKEEFRTKAVKDRTAVTGAVWMGLTLNCAECHSHKYDPVSQREYYQLYAFFNSTDDDQFQDAPTLRFLERPTRLHRRGNFLELGAPVDPGVPAFLPDLLMRNSRPDRLDLARWLVSPHHPLTGRVAVNQLWQHLFARGLVATPENFGLRGEPPSHPELIDWLAARFAGLPLANVVDSAGDVNGASATPTRPSSAPTPGAWSRKALIRLLVVSSSYRQSSANDRPGHAEIDPENRLLWRQNRIRLEAEIVRDIALATSGLLDTSLGGPSIQPTLPKVLRDLDELKNERFQESSGRPYRRGLYVHMQRTYPYPMFAAFDGPDGNACTIVRDRSITATQALTLLNDPAIDECCRALGQRLMESTADDSGRVRHAFEWCLGRAPSPAEEEIIRQLVRQQQEAGASESLVWAGVARTMLNLDETITRE